MHAGCMQSCQRWLQKHPDDEGRLWCIRNPHQNQSRLELNFDSSACRLHAVHAGCMQTCQNEVDHTCHWLILSCVSDPFAHFSMLFLFPHLTTLHSLGYKWLILPPTPKSIMADRVVRCIHQKMAAYVVFWPGKVACHKIFNLSTFVLPKISCAVICQCFSATYCCVGNGSPLSLIHASMRKSPSQF